MHFNKNRAANGTKQSMKTQTRLLQENALKQKRKLGYCSPKQCVKIKMHRHIRYSSWFQQTEKQFNLRSRIMHRKLAE